jgi:hypothetical protein
MLVPRNPDRSQPSHRWATVTATSPLRIRLDGDTDPLPYTPDSLVAGLAVADRVWVQLAAGPNPDRRSRRVIIMGRAGGPSTATTDALNARLTALDGPWSTWTPTLTNLTVGAGGSVVARYSAAGKRGDYLFVFTLGTGSAVGTGPTFTLPFTPHSSLVAFSPIGVAQAFDTGVNNYALVPRWTGTAVALVGIGTAGVHTTVTATAPFTFGSGDILLARGSGIELA